MRHTAETLEQSAKLADEHSLRREQAGKRHAAEDERQAAARAREGARRARAYADAWQQRAGQ